MSTRQVIRRSVLRHGEFRRVIPTVGRGEGRGAAAAGRARARGDGAGFPMRRERGGDVRPVGRLSHLGLAERTQRVDAAGGREGAVRRRDM